MAAGLFVFVASLIAGELILGPWVFKLVGFPAFVAVFVVSIVGHFCFFRCPACRGNLAPLIFAHGPRRVDPRIRFCPYCGTDVDAELPAESAEPVPKQ
jgi:hypothetical protein